MNITKSEIKDVVTNLFDNALEGTNTHQIIGNVDIEVLPKSSKDRVDVFIAKADEGTTNFYDRPRLPRLRKSFSIDNRVQLQRYTVQTQGLIMITSRV